MTEEDKKTEEHNTEQQPGPAEAGGPAEAEGPPGPGEKLPMDFSTFILSLSSSVLMNLGMLENPVTGETDTDTAQAKQTIDLIDLLKDKTRGNLTESEDKLVEDVLYELRMRYVEKTKS